MLTRNLLTTEIRLIRCDICGGTILYDYWDGQHYDTHGDPIKVFENEITWESHKTVCSRDCYDNWMDSMVRSYRGYDIKKSLHL